MRISPNRARPQQKLGTLWRITPVVGAALLTGLLFLLLAAPDKASGDWIFFALAAVVTLTLWVVGVRRLSVPPNGPAAPRKRPTK